MVPSDRIACLCRQCNAARDAALDPTAPLRTHRAWVQRRVALEDAVRILEIEVSRDEDGFITAFKIFNAWKEI